MDNAGAQKKDRGQTPSVLGALWDPFGFVQAMFGWLRPGSTPLFEVKETDDTYVCKVNVQLTLPDQADVARAKAELDKGELTFVVPKAAAAPPEPASTAGKPAAAPEPAPRTTRRAKASGNRDGSARRTPRRGKRSAARRR